MNLKKFAMDTMIDAAINSAINHPEKISSALGRSSIRAFHKNPDEVRKALIDAKKLLPLIRNKGTNAKGAASILKNLNVNKGFLDQAYDAVSPYISKIPGLDPATAKSALNTLKDNLDEPIPVKNSAKKSSGFNSSKYPRV